MAKNLFTQLKGKIKNAFENFQEARDNWNQKIQPKTARLPRRTADEGEKKYLIEFSLSNIAKGIAIAIVVLVPFYFLFQIGDILVLFFVSFLCAAALDPIVDFLHSKKIPRSIAILLIYLVVFLILGLLIASLIPLLAKQMGDIASSIGTLVRNLNQGNASFPFSKELTPYIQQFYQTIDLQAASNQVQTGLQYLATQLLNISVGFMNILLVFVLTFFMTVEEKAMEDFCLSLFPSRYGKYISTRLEAIKEKVGYWLRGQLILSLAAAILSYIGLLILGVNYALTLAIISGITMIIPVFGRVFAWALAMPIVLNQSPALALWVSIYYLILQQIENNALVPYIMNKVIGLSPIVIIFAMSVGAKFLGILGLVISIPITTMVAIFVKDYTEREK